MIESGHRMNETSQALGAFFHGFRKVFQQAYFGSTVDCINSGLVRGFPGVESNSIRACCGVLPPFLLLHFMQQQTMLSQVVFPPCDRGIT
jgi:hypothetical protein